MQSKNNRTLCRKRISLFEICSEYRRDILRWKIRKYLPKNNETFFLKFIGRYVLIKVQGKRYYLVCHVHFMQ